MLRLVDERGEIANAQREFEKKMDSITDRDGEVLAGWKGGNKKPRISRSNELGIWWVLSQNTGNRIGMHLEQGALAGLESNLIASIVRSTFPMLE